MPWWDAFRLTSRTGVAVGAPPKRAPSDEPTGSQQPWQKAAWGYYKTLGEIHYACSFYARMLAGITLLTQERNDAGEWVDSTDETLVGSLERLENGKGGIASLQAQFAVLLFMQGEALLACTLEGEEDAQPGDVYECWEMLSTAELTYTKKGAGGVGEYTRRRRVGTGKDEKIPETDPDDPKPGTMTAYRFYKRDPEFSGMADASMRAVLEDCEELLLLKRAIRNTARNRGAGNGVLVMPASMGDATVDAGDGTKISKNAKAIYDALTAPIANEQASHAVTPVIVFAPNGTTSQDVFHVDLRGAALYKETGLRDECIRRIAIGLDMPPEKLSGTASSNHWTAWQIDDASWTEHGDPVARKLCEDLTDVLLIPAAEEAGMEPNNVRVWFDATEVIQDPDRGRAAQEAHDRLTISDESYRRESGFEEDDAPTPEEWDKRAAIGHAPRGTTPTTGTGPPGSDATIERIIGMAEACYLRCRELAGSRLRTKMQSNGTPANLRARISGASNSEVSVKLGREVADEVDADVLVAGGGLVILEGLFRMGLERGLSETLIRRIEEHAARTLFDEPGDLPDEVLAICGLLSMQTS
jgi:hypothetical protein